MLHAAIVKLYLHNFDFDYINIFLIISDTYLFIASVPL